METGPEYYLIKYKVSAYGDMYIEKDGDVNYVAINNSTCVG